MIDHISEFYGLVRSANRYTAPTLRPKLDALLADIRRDAPRMADWMEAEEYLPLGFLSYETAIAKLQEVTEATDSTAKDRMRALAALAQITHGAVPVDRNYEWRAQAIEVARENGWKLAQLVFTVNWGIAAHQAGSRELGRRLFSETRRLLKSLPKTARNEQVIADVRLRMGVVEANVSLHDLRNEPVEALKQALPGIVAKHREALGELPGSAHRQVNTRVEFAAELIKLGLGNYAVTRHLINSELEAAHRGLDAHACAHCEAYYAEVNGARHELHGMFLLSSDGKAAVESLRVAASELERAGGLWRDHPHKASTQDLLKRVKAMIDAESRPRRVFLSHSSKDKPLVREFRRVLETLQYEPWLDEDAMTAGTSLERGLLEGMKSSCAAVFFVTSSFVDSNYLATEVEYAIQQKRANGDQFTIITLVLGGADDSRVPELLRTYVYKKPPNELEALHELVRALPLAPARPVWKS